MVGLAGGVLVPMETPERVDSAQTAGWVVVVVVVNHQGVKLEIWRNPNLLGQISAHSIPGCV